MIHRRLNSRSGHAAASRKLVAAVLAAMCSAAPSLLSAQESADSLLARLRRLEATVKVLEQQVAEQSDPKVRTLSGASLTFAGRIAVNSFANVRRVNNVDNPQFVLPDVPTPTTPMRGAGMSVRQTRLRMMYSGLPSGFGPEISGAVDVDFYGGQVPSSGGRTFPLLRIRTATALMRWTNAELMVGQESPLISGLNPKTPAAIGTPAFATSGNLWLWLPQVRFGLHTRGVESRLRFDVAALAPTSGDAAAAFDTDNDMAERSMRPFLQARVSYSGGDQEAETRHELGCGVHQGWLMPGLDRESSSAIACDAFMDLTGSIEIRAEGFSGQALRGLGGGGIGQNFNLASDPLRTSGGWAQVNYARESGTTLGIACGADHPRSAPTRRRNDSCAAHAAFEPLSGFLVGAEVRRIRTEYPIGRFTNDHVTLVLGWGF
jgi:hypothetical protein